MSKEIGVPYIVLFKECLITNKKHHDRIVDFYSRFDRECVSSIVVHNQKSKYAVQESGVVGERPSCIVRVPSHGFLCFFSSAS